MFGDPTSEYAYCLFLQERLWENNNPIIKHKLIHLLRQLGPYKAENYTTKEIMNQVKKKCTDLEPLPVTHVAED